MQDRLFSLEEANALLSRVLPLLEQLRDAQAIMEERHGEVMSSATGNGGGEAGAEFLHATNLASRCATELDEMGILVRDPSTGLIDFPSLRDGEVIYLCWRLGEDDIAWWHPPETGFAGRQPL